MREYRRSVVVKDDNVERALRKFKKKIQESGLLDELRTRETYEKPTTKRKRKKGAATQGAGGSDGDNDALGMRGGKEYAQESAKTEGLCK